MSAVRSHDASVPSLEQEVTNVYSQHLFCTFGETVSIPLGDFKMVVTPNEFIAYATEETNIGALDVALQQFSKMYDHPYRIVTVEKLPLVLRSV